MGPGLLAHESPRLTYSYASTGLPATDGLPRTLTARNDAVHILIDDPPRLRHGSDVAYDSVGIRPPLYCSKGSSSEGPQAVRPYPFPRIQGYEGRYSTCIRYLHRRRSCMSASAGSDRQPSLHKRNPQLWYLIHTIACSSVYHPRCTEEVSTASELLPCVEMCTPGFVLDQSETRSLGVVRGLYIPIPIRVQDDVAVRIRRQPRRITMLPAR